MNKIFENYPYMQSKYWELIISTLSSYQVKVITSGGKVEKLVIEDKYFLVKNVWHLDYIGQIPGFEERYKNYSIQRAKTIKFPFNKASVAFEIKFLFFHKLFNDELKLSTLFKSYRSDIIEFAKFINEKYPNLDSLLDLHIDRVEREWLFWLNNRNKKTKRICNDLKYGEIQWGTVKANFLRNMYKKLLNLTDKREEWEKDRWDVRILDEKFGITYSLSSTNYFVDFSNIENVEYKINLKKYVKTRLLTGKSFSWGTARTYLATALPHFLNFITNIEPKWNDLNGLTRDHMLRYFEFMRNYIMNTKKNRNANPKRLISRNISIVNTFLSDIQRLEYTIAPIKPVYKLIYSDDYPTVDKPSDDVIDYIPDYVLNQLFENINDLNVDIQPIIWVSFKTGLRISDTLGLKQDSLIKLNGKYSIQTDIEKTYTKGHKIPIDDHLANIIAVLIHNSKEQSNDDNNPNKYIFVRYRGSRKGKPFLQNWVQKQLNELAIRKNITDELGNVFHFKTHQFRHTYAVKMLNGGADILTVQELLAHASPEMTMRYARLLDDTKRKEFEKVVKKGLFTFDLNGEIHHIDETETIPEYIIDMMWKDEKLNSLDNPYGTCHARINGNCPLAAEPPCLTANDGKPCFDLAVGMTSFDIKKYELHIESATKMIEASKEYGRQDMVEANERNLERFRNIYETIKNGNVIFGRFDRMKRQIDRKKKKGVTHG